MVDLHLPWHPKIQVVWGHRGPQTLLENRGASADSLTSVTFTEAQVESLKNPFHLRPRSQDP